MTWTLRVTPIALLFVVFPFVSFVAASDVVDAAVFDSYLLCVHGDRSVSAWSLDPMSLDRELSERLSARPISGDVPSVVES